MKAILVVNKMPKNSEECPFFEKWKGYDKYDYCSGTSTTVIGNSDKRCNGCPLKPMPEQKKGKWIDVQDPYGFFETIPVCSECGCTTKMRDKYNFCPNCGADMRGENESNTCD